MELRVESTLFSSNGGGGGGGMYQGRQDQGDQPKKKHEAPQDEVHLDGDAMDIQPSFRSRMAFLPTTPAPAIDLEALEEELKDRVRYLHLSVSFMERKLNRATSAVIGSVLIAG